MGIRFTFDQEKAAQVAARFLASTNGHMPYMRLIKLMYLADRESLRVRCSPIIGDAYVSMKDGPVVSHVYDLIKGRFLHSEIWDKAIATDAFNVRLNDDPGIDALSKRELFIIDELAQKFAGMDQWDLRDWCHENCREWQDPTRIDWPTFSKGSIDIEVEEIFQALEMPLTHEDLKSIEQEASLRGAILNDACG